MLQGKTVKTAKVRGINEKSNFTLVVTSGVTCVYWGCNGTQKSQFGSQLSLDTVWCQNFTLASFSFPILIFSPWLG